MNLLHELPFGPDTPKVIHDLPHIPRRFPAEKGHSFEVYKELAVVPAKALGWERATVAREQIEDAVDLCRHRFGEQEPEPEA